MLPIAGILLAVSMATPAQTVQLKPGMTLTKSCKVAAYDYLIPTQQGTAKAGDEEIPTLSPAIVIKGNNLVIDFAGSVLRGSPSTVDPDKRKGLGILVQGDNITLKNLTVRGYMVGLWAKNCTHLRIEKSNFSYNWKQHLMSTVDKEDLSDWQSYHHNEHNEWLRYGAAMYFEGCEKFAVEHTRSVGGQCGLMLVRSNNGLVRNNDFSFNSGVGLGLYHSSSNKVLNNKIDWCVRGFSYGVYNRGQDSAGILIFELCHNNVFAFNSVTHGGDGFFMWAGQTMMDTGRGGCNGNILYGNDFSHSPCNAIEATFASNSFVNNKLVECWHGVWGGFSFDTKIVGNIFGYNGEAIAIEHGQDIAINHNVFIRDNGAINLWQDPITDKSWKYPKYHDTDSRDYQIFGNKFIGTATTVIQIRNTNRVNVVNNSFKNSGPALKESGNGKGNQIDLSNVVAGQIPPRTISTGGLPVAGTSDNQKEYLSRFDIPWAPFATVGELQELKRPLTEAEQRVVDSQISVAGGHAGQNAFLKPGALRGQRYILVDQWGPYDFKSPKLWVRNILSKNSDRSMKRRFEILGPVGKWHLKSKSAGISLSVLSGSVPGFVDVEMPAKQAGLTKIELEYVGGATTDFRGITTRSGMPVTFGFSEFFSPIDWDIRFFKWDEATDPRTQAEAFKSLIAGEPVKELHANKVDFGGASFDPSVGNDHYATVCNGSFEVPAGKYQLAVTTDDGARVWVDGKPVITNAWKYQGPTLYNAELQLAKGTHKIRVEHFQIDGYAALKVTLNPIQH